MSHPSLGLPPRDMTAGDPAAAAAIRTSLDRLAERALEAAVVADPTFAARYDERALRRLLVDTATLIEVISRSVASGDARITRGWCEMAVPVYRRHGVSMDDLATIAQGVREVLVATLDASAAAHANAALDGAVEVFRWNRRLGGDTRPRNRILKAIYKGA